MLPVSIMRWESVEQPKYVWMGDEWWNPRTREIYVAYESGWKSRKKWPEKNVAYDLDVKVFYSR